MSEKRAVHEALVALFNATPAITDEVGPRIYDRVPEGRTFPYIRMGDPSSVTQSEDCRNGWEVAQDVHVFSRDYGRGETYDIVGAITSAIFAAARARSITHTSYAFRSFRVTGSRVLDDPDGLSTHGVVTVEAVVEPIDP